MLARFIRHYGAGVYRSPSYATRDQVIPFGFFWILYYAMTPNSAYERVNESRAIIHALASAFGEKGQSRELTATELREAFLGGG